MQNRLGVGALHLQGPVDLGLIVDLDQKALPATLDQFRLGGAPEHLDPGLGIDLHHGDAVRIQDLLNQSHEFFVRRMIAETQEPLLVFGLQPASQEGQRLVESDRLGQHRLGLNSSHPGQFLSLEWGNRPDQAKPDQESASAKDNCFHLYLLSFDLTGLFRSPLLVHKNPGRYKESCVFRLFSG